MLQLAEMLFYNLFQVSHVFFFFLNSFSFSFS